MAQAPRKVRRVFGYAAAKRRIGEVAAVKSAGVEPALDGEHHDAVHVQAVNQHYQLTFHAAGFADHWTRPGKLLDTIVRRR